MKCDTCHREVPEVSRVVVYIGYNKLFSKAIYNCPECFAKKEETKKYNQDKKQDTQTKGE